MIGINGRVLARPSLNSRIETLRTRHALSNRVFIVFL
jgi:hypothetical protein